MKFKEKDPVISMEQWFPDKPLEYVKEFNGHKSTYIQYGVYKSADPKLELPSLFERSGIVNSEFQSMKVFLVEYSEGDRKHWTTKFGEASVDGSCGQRHMLSFVTPGDWVLTYKSGRREVLTDKEKQERFE